MSYAEDHYRRHLIEELQEAWNYAETLTHQYDEQETKDQSIPRDKTQNQGRTAPQP